MIAWLFESAKARRRLDGAGAFFPRRGLFLDLAAFQDRLLGDVVVLILRHDLLVDPAGFIGFSLGSENAGFCEESHRRAKGGGVAGGDFLKSGESLIDFSLGFLVGRQAGPRAADQFVLGKFIDEIAQDGGGFVEFALISQFICEEQLGVSGRRRARVIGDDFSKIVLALCGREDFRRRGELVHPGPFKNAIGRHRQDEDARENQDFGLVMKPKYQWIKSGFGGGSRWGWTGHRAGNGNDGNGEIRMTNDDHGGGNGLTWGG